MRAPGSLRIRRQRRPDRSHHGAPEAHRTSIGRWCAEGAPDFDRELASLEAVARAADGLDHVSAQLLAERVDVDVDDVRRRIERVAPHVGQQLSATQNLAGVAKKRLEQRELTGGELDRPAVDRRPPRPEIDSYLAGLEHVRLGCSLASQAGLHAREQLVEMEGLPHVVVRAGLEAHHYVPLAPPGEHEHGKLLSARPKVLQHLEPLPLGKAHVEDEEIELVGQAQALRLLAVVGEKGRVAVRAQALLEKGADQRVVLGDQDSGHSAAPWLACFGTTMVKVDPSPRRLSSSTCPPCASAIALTSARPSPPPAYRRWASVPRVKRLKMIS